MTFEEKRLYHQIHPVKLFTDISTAVVSVFLLWMHMLAPAIVLAIVPSVIVSVLIMKTADLDHYKNSRFGRYALTYMDSRFVDTARFSGFILTAFGGRYQSVALICIGAAVIIICWIRGLLFKRKINAA